VAQFIQTGTGNTQEVVLLAYHSEAVLRSDKNIQKEDSRISIDQSFILKVATNGEEAGEGSPDGRQDLEAWPFVVISHQMVVRDGPMLKPKALNRLVSGIFNAKG